MGNPESQVDPNGTTPFDFHDMNKSYVGVGSNGEDRGALGTGQEEGEAAKDAAFDAGCAAASRQQYENDQGDAVAATTGDAGSGNDAPDPDGGGKGKPKNAKFSDEEVEQVKNASGSGSQQAVSISDGSQQTVIIPDKYGGLESYRAYQSYPGEIPGETKWDRIFRLMAASHREEMLDFGGGGYNMLGGYGKVAGVERVIKGGTELFDFGESAAKHMAEPGRAVPIQILEQAIKGSKGIADPKGSRALMHSAEMWRNGKPYQLDVLYDKTSNSIWHFQYSPIKP